MTPSRFVPLGSSDKKLSEDDLCGALFCSMAVYMTNAEAESFFREPQFCFPSITVDKVHMSLNPSEGGPRQKFLVAYIENCIFIAFRGTENLHDVACDIKINRHYQKFGGTFHKGFFDRADAFMGSNHSPLRGLLKTGKRIIFCGHSLGGAVAHMVLLRFLLEYDLLLNNETHPESMISITFGAPHICDARAALHINGNENYKWRFINFVNQMDPVPHMLHYVRGTVPDALRFALAEADSMLQSLGGFAARCIEGFADGGPKEALRVAGQETGHLIARSCVACGRKIIRKWRDSSIQENDSSEVPRKPDFHPIGLYVSLHWNADQEGRWSVSQDYGGDVKMRDPIFCRHVELTRENVIQHQMASYRKVLIAVSFIDSPTLCSDSVPSNPGQSPQLGKLVRTPAPKVTFAKWSMEDPDSNQRYIEVKGENLLFLREAVTVTGSQSEQEAWNIIDQSDNFLLINDPHVGPKELEKAISTLVIKTAFGQIRHHSILEDYPLHEGTQIGASRMIFKIVQSLIVKATPPLSISLESNADVMTVLDDIMHCVPLLKEERVSSKLIQITKITNGGDLGNLTKDINYLFKSVVDYLQLRRRPWHCLRVDYKSPALQSIKQRAHLFLKRHPELGIPAVVAGILVFPMTFGAALLGVLIFRPSQTIMEGYDGYQMLLKLAILESSEWSESSESENNDDQAGTHSWSIDHLEMVLHQKVEGSAQNFKDMVKKAHEMSKKDVPCFKSAVFLNATSDSRLKLLRRIKVVYDTISLYQKVVVGTHFIAILGNEDAGKSTFIKKVLKRFGPRGAQNLPKTGFRTHTNIVKAYKLNSSLWLVDFPGANGAERYSDEDGAKDQRFADLWKQFTALSSSAILFLDFKFDITMEDIKMYREMKEDLGAGTEVTIVFNKVDIKYTDRYEGWFSVENLKHQREKNRTDLGCSTYDTSGKDDIYFSCVDPDIPLEKLSRLKNMGVLGFEELMKVVYPALALNSSGISQSYI